MTDQIKPTDLAPFVYFDSAPIFGTVDGAIEVRLEARIPFRNGSGRIVAEPACTAHLRCSPAAAARLVKSLQDALAMLEASQTNPPDGSTVN